jgi:hypothetical protein
VGCDGQNVEGCHLSVSCGQNRTLPIRDAAALAHRRACAFVCTRARFLYRGRPSGMP